MDRQIVCLRIPSFDIALARLEDPSLRARPVAVAAATHPRAVLREVSAEAYREGLTTGMAIDHARWLCPSIRLLPPSGARIRRGQQQVQELIGHFAPVWEPAGPGHLFLDLTGTQRLFGAAVDAASRIGREVGQRVGLAAALGVGTNKLVTDVAATLVSPADLYDVPPGGERRFMAPLPPDVLPELARPAARTLAGLLQDLNMSTLGAIADVPLPLLQLIAGAVAIDLHRRAQGIDESPVTSAPARPRVTESLILDSDTVDAQRVRAGLFTLIELVGRQLRRREQRTRRLRVTLVHSDFVETSRETVVEPETNVDALLFAVAETLLRRAFTRRVRLRRLIVDAEIGWRPHEQLMLFPRRTREQASRRTPDAEKVRRLTEAVDRIRGRYGDAAVRWGRVLSG